MPTDALKTKLAKMIKALDKEQEAMMTSTKRMQQKISARVCAIESLALQIAQQEAQDKA